MIKELENLPFEEMLEELFFFHPGEEKAYGEFNESIPVFKVQL